MKLVDILARELKEWPDRALYAWQDWNLEIRFRHSMENDFFVDRKSCDHVRQKHEGNPNQGVTRSQWQAAVDALKAGEQVWDGEGLPPVGVEIEISHRRAQPDWANPGFYKAVIVAMGDQLMILKADGNGHEKVATIADYHFRPARTAEQIAEQEHREAVEALAAATDWILTRVACEAVLAAGYRKQEVQQ